MCPYGYSPEKFFTPDALVSNSILCPEVYSLPISSRDAPVSWFIPIKLTKIMCFFVLISRNLDFSFIKQDYKICTPLSLLKPIQSSRSLHLAYFDESKGCDQQDTLLFPIKMFTLWPRQWTIWGWFQGMDEILHDHKWKLHFSYCFHQFFMG